MRKLVKKFKKTGLKNPVRKEVPSLSGVKEISESLREWERIAAHSHITGLGLEGLKAKPVASGMVGQVEAREAAGIVVRLIKEGKFAGRAVLLAGPPGTGKTAIATAIARELGRDVPFVPLAASEIFSADIKKTEFLMQTLRKAIGARIHEVRKIYEGEVKEVSIEKAPHPYNPYQQIPAGATIKIATTDESKRLTMDQSFATQLIQQGIETGDIVQIDPEGGRIVKLGKSRKSVEEKKVDLSTSQVLDVPNGNVLKEKEFVYPVTLYALDMAAARRGGDIFSIFFGGRESKEIEPETRREVDEYVKTLVQEGRCELLPGVVFIDECSMLDIETFAFLNRALEQELAPIIIFATNRGFSTVRGTDMRAPHGMPLDLLDRLLIINTKPYSRDEIRKILEIRAEAEKIPISKEAMEYLTEIGVNTSLRYAVQLVAPAFELAKERKSDRIEKDHVSYVERLFVDVKKSVEYLREYEKQFLDL